MVENNNSFGHVIDPDGTIYIGGYASGSSSEFRWQGGYPSASGAFISVYSVNGGTYKYSISYDATQSTHGITTVNSGELIYSTQGVKNLLIISKIE